MSRLRRSSVESRLGDRAFDAALGRRHFRSWSEQSIDALRAAVERR